MLSKDEKLDGWKNRRDVLKKTGAAIPGITALSLMKPVAADDESEPGPDINPCGEPSGDCFETGYGIDVTEVADNISPSEACDITVASCWFYTALAAGDVVPGDEIALGITCAGGALGCTVYDALKDEHGEKDLQLVRADESQGDISEDDYIAVPSDWGWQA